MMRRFISAFRIWPASNTNTSFSQSASFDEPHKTLNAECDNDHLKDNEDVTCVHEMSSSELLEHLQLFFKPVSTNEDLRIQRYQNVSFLLSICQDAAANYAFCQNKHAREFLLKARYREEKDNFFNSLYLEPKCGSASKLHETSIDLRSQNVFECN